MKAIQGSPLPSLADVGESEERRVGIDVGSSVESDEAGERSEEDEWRDGGPGLAVDGHPRLLPLLPVPSLGLPALALILPIKYY